MSLDIEAGKLLSHTLQSNALRLFQIVPLEHQAARRIPGDGVPDRQASS